MTLPPPGVAVILITLVLIAAVYDVKQRRIPNWLTVTGILTGVGMNTFLYPVWSGLKSGLLGFAVGFGIYFVLYALHAMGAGDVKLMGAVGALVGWQNWLGIFAITALVGGIMAIIVILARKRFMKTVFNVGFIFSEMKSGRAAYMSREDLDVKSPKSMGLPHGAVIAVGVFFFLAMSAHFTH